MSDMEENKMLSEEELEQVDGGAGKNTKIVEYTVKHGDTLIRIANHYRTSVSAIMRLNAIIKDKNFIVSGWVLRVYDNR